MAEIVPQESAEVGVDQGIGTSFERTSVFWLTNFSHAVNHFQNQMVALLYVVIMPELGFGYQELGILTAVMILMGGVTQGFYGFLTPFVPRPWLLGIGNIVLGLGTLATGWVGSYGAFLGARAVSATGGSAQHPVGSSLLVSYFPQRRGTVLSFNMSFSNIGSLLAPMAAGLLLLILDWRQIFMLVAALSIVMGAAYFLFRDRVGADQRANQTSRVKLARGKESYIRALRNRNVLLVSLVMAVGGAGRDMGVNLAFLGPHFSNDLKLDTTMVAVALTALQVGGIIGPVVLGWLSDRMSRKLVVQMSLVLSSVATLWLAFQGAFLPMLLMNLVFYGMVTRSRMTLTQAIVSDSMPDADRDAAFSVFFLLGVITAPFWAWLVGFLMENLGFTFAFSVLGFSYVAGILLMFFVVDTRNSANSSAVPVRA
ncbi:MAG TPA: MFS transporter [Dehalococcoidia bacterium]|nr:MFS transporter [Dehalococcoidia bacterium]